MRIRMFAFLSALASALALTSPVAAQLTVPGANGSDGALNVTANTSIDLSQAVPGAWDANSPQPGKGVYDGAKWAVVFHYTSVNVAQNATLTFKNNAARAPVVWLVSGNVTIAGTVSLDAFQALAGVIEMPEPGPGGFRGGLGGVSPTLPAGAGFGPGGGFFSTSNGGPGSYATRSSDSNAGVPYGNIQVLPLLGGSGGAATLNSTGGDRSGGSGGGAILIAATGSVTVNGTIHADGSNPVNIFGGPGSGGGIRIVANSVAGTGNLTAVGGGGHAAGGNGRIRVETPSYTGSLTVLPETSIASPANPVLVFPDATAPTVEITKVNNAAVPADPRASLGPAPADVRFFSAAPVAVEIVTKNLDPAATAVTLRVTPKNGNAFTTAATLVSGNTALATWTATVSSPADFYQGANITPQGFAALQARADPKG